MSSTIRKDSSILLLESSEKSISSHNTFEFLPFKVFVIGKLKFVCKVCGGVICIG